MPAQPGQALPQDGPRMGGQPSSLAEFAMRSPARRIPSRILRRFALACCLLTLTLSALVLVGWAVGDVRLNEIKNDGVNNHPLTKLMMEQSNSMVLNTAFCFVMLAMALGLHLYPPVMCRRRLVQWLCLATLAYVVGELLEFACRYFGPNVRWDKLPAIGPLFVWLRQSEMAPLTALCFLLLAVGLLVLTLRPGKWQAAAGAAAGMLVLSVNFMFLGGYFNEAEAEFQIFQNVLGIAVAFPTALNFLILSLGLTASPGAQRIFFRRFFRRNTTGLLLRWFLPMTACLMIMLMLIGEFIRSRYLAHNKIEEAASTHAVRNAAMLASWEKAKRQAEANNLPEPALKEMSLGEIHNWETRRRKAWVGAMSFPWVLFAILTISYLVYRVSGKVGLDLEKTQGALEKAMEKMWQAREKAERATVSRDLFLAQVSHELRTPLNHILGYCQLLEFTELQEDQLQDLKKISLAGNHLLSLINDILDYQKIIMGQIPVEIEEFDAASWIKEIAETMEPKVRENNNRFEVHCDSSLGTVRADRKRFRQILTNLLSNAAKFTKNGTVSIEAHRESRDQKELISVSVVDTGKGISKENQAKLFKPFSQIDDRRDNPEGTGLGLAICKTLCEKMAGDIRVLSELGYGARFTFRLPPAQPSAKDTLGPLPCVPTLRPTEQTLPSIAPEELPSPRTCTVLVVDDDPHIGELMKRFFENQGFTIHVAASGGQALEMVKIIRPSVITLDLMMPGIDGWGVLAALKNDAETADIPVVIVSIMENKTKGFRLGAAEYITKPVDWDRLSAILHLYKKSRDNSILLVDDDPNFREICRRSLQKEGWKVVEAENGQRAMQRLAEFTPSLILLDLMMPVMNGFEVLEQLRGNAALQAIPVIILTAKDISEQDRHRLNGGVREVLQKDQRSLDDLLRDLLQDIKKYVKPSKELPHVQDTAR